jgi:cytochrome c oxidase accessory protein FixG
MSASFTLPQLDERVLSTLHADGTRRWMDPRPVHGRLYWRRLVVAWSLMAVFSLLPWLRLHGKPPILLDVMTRQFTFFGTTFRPTETLLVAALLAIVFLGVFLATAVLGRVWCGWACPQTVYLEFLYRPIERWIGGGRGRQVPGWRRVLVYAVFLVVSAHLANTFLAYFVGTDRLVQWTIANPSAHPTAFAVFAVVTGLMLFDFAFFREQLCTLVCPYGRFQSVLLDRDSLIVAYDPRRGEPRGGLSQRKVRSGAGEPSGQCIDCSWCVQVCPTGIDIRNGLQMECIHCTQCIDACDAVMDRTHQPRGLIRYASQRRIAGEGRAGFRWRVAIYATLLSGLVVTLAMLLANRRPTLVEQVRLPGTNFHEPQSGRIQTPLRLLLENRTDALRTYRVSGVADVELAAPLEGVEVPPAETRTVDLAVITDVSSFRAGSRAGMLRVIDDQDRMIDVPVAIAGPFGGSR